MKVNRLIMLVTVAALAMAVVAPACAGLIGSNTHISGVSRFPDVAYDSVDAKYLVVWQQSYDTWGRFVSNGGALVGNPFMISDGTDLAWYPAVAYNSTNNEFLVTWDANDGRVRGRRVRGSDGALLGGVIVIGSSGGARSSVAWSATSNCYFVVYYSATGNADVSGQRVSSTGTLLGSQINISNDAYWSAYPSVGWNPANNQFLVTWDYENGAGYIDGQRVDAATGSLVGSRIPVSRTGGASRSQVTCDTVNGRWMVQNSMQANPGYSFDQYGQLINSDGSLYGSPIMIAHTAAFEGETLLGCDIAFAPGLGRFLGIFQYNDDMGAQEVYASGSLQGSRVILGTLTGGAMAVAADTNLNRFLSVWESFEGSYPYVHYQLYEAPSSVPPGPVSNFVAAAGTGQNVLSWHNPSEATFTGTMIRFKTTGFPTSATDGTLVVDKANTPNTNDSYTHSGLTNETTYYYAAFAHNSVPAYAAGITASAKPSLVPGLTLIPKPQELTWKTSLTGFLVNSSTQIMANSNPDAKETNMAQQLQRKVWDMTGYLPNIVYGGSATSNVIAVGDPARCPAVSSIIATWSDASGKASKTEGYMMGIKDTSIFIRGFDSAGAFYGSQTLIQLLEHFRTNRISALFTYDYPDMPLRGGMWKFIDNHDWQFTKELTSEMLARYKLNAAFVRVDNGMQWDSHPELPLNNPTNPVTKAMYTDYFNFANLHYMVKMPSSAGSYHNSNEWLTFGTLNSSLRENTSEAETDTSESLCPLHSGAQGLVLDLWNEVNASTNTPFFGAGHSEYHSLRWSGCPRCTAYASNAALYSQLIWNDYNWCDTRGKEQIIFGDMLRAEEPWGGSPSHWNTAPAVSTIPDATIIEDWEYGSPSYVPTDYPTLDRWISNGLYCIGMPYGFGSLPAYNQYYGDKENIYYWSTALNSRKASGKIRGMIAFNKYTAKDRQVVINSALDTQLLGCFPYYAAWGWNAGDPYWNPYPYGNGWGMVERQISPDKVSGLVATPSGSNVILAWTNPPESKFQAAYIVYRTDRYPTSPIDGTYLADVSGSPNAAGNYTHVSAPASVYYAVFAHDNVRHFSPAATARNGGYCFEEQFTYSDGALVGRGGWTGTATSSHITIVNNTVKILGGSGAYDAIKTVSCSADATGYITVTCKINGEVGAATMWNLWIDDSSSRNLARWYGTATTARGRIGTTSTVTAEKTLSGAWETLSVKIHPANNTTEFFFNDVSLGVYSHSATGAGDAVGRLRFERVSNSSAAGHSIYFDELTIGTPPPAQDTTPPGPVTGFAASPGESQVSLSWTNPGDSDFAGVKVLYKTTGYPANSTDGTVIYNGAGTSTVHEGLSDGTTYYYSAFAYDEVPNYSTSTTTSATPSAEFCYRDTFMYADGALTGNGGWSGTSGSAQIAINGDKIKMFGGAGSFDSIQAVSCTEEGRGYIMVRVLAYPGTGASTMWSLWIDDPAGNNLARWYGTGTTARGRIGSTASVTAEQTLQGNSTWDSLVVKIVPSANTSQFFFNGANLGTLSHSSEGAGDTIGRIRIERVDNGAAAGHSMYLDDLRLGGD